MKIVACKEDRVEEEAEVAGCVDGVSY